MSIPKVPVDENNPSTYVICPICNKKMVTLGWSHAKSHNLTVKELRQKYPETEVQSPQKAAEIKKRDEYLILHKEKIISEYCAGRSQWKIGKDLGVSQSVISVFISENSDAEIDYRKIMSDRMKLMHADPNSNLTGWGKQHRNKNSELNSERVKKIKSVTMLRNTKNPNFIEKKLAWARSEAAKEMRSTAAKRMNADKDCLFGTVGWGKNGFYKSIKGGRVLYRSTWELTVIKMLDDAPEILKFDTDYPIPYRDRNNKECTYYCDFIIYYVNGKRKLLEIKGNHLFEEFYNGPKYEAAMRYSEAMDIPYDVWTGKSINWGVL